MFILGHGRIHRRSSMFSEPSCMLLVREEYTKTKLLCAYPQQNKMTPSPSRAFEHKWPSKKDKTKTKTRQRHIRIQDVNHHSHCQHKGDVMNN